MKNRIVTFYTDNIPSEVVQAQKAVFDKFNIPLEQIKPEKWHGHAGTIDRYIESIGDDWDTLTIFDIDCIPLDESIVWQSILWANSGIGILGMSQKASHIPDSITYIGPAYIVFSRDTYTALGRPKFECTERSDCAGELTYAALENGIPTKFMYPTHVEVPLWDLGNGQQFGKGTMYDDRIYHAFYSRKDNGEMFIRKCNELLNN